jgi:uncharacterized membrane-anchored protein
MISVAAMLTSRLPILVAALALAPAVAHAEPSLAGPEADTPADAVNEPGAAQEEAPATEEDEVAAFERSLTFRAGALTLAGGKVRLSLTDRFRYLDPQDAERVLTAWGNPPGMEQEGMIVPANESLFADAAYAVILSYTDDGHVSDEDAREIDFDELLESMQDDTRAANPERIDAGFPASTLHGWAEPPRYDPASHKLYWAKDLSFEGDASHTLNYDVRVLGREGYLEMSAVTTLEHLDRVRAEMPQVMGVAEFTNGNRYQDFDEDTDRMAEYGLAALIAGGVAQKAGLFKGLLALLVASKKLIIAAVTAFGIFLKKIFERRGSDGTDAS